MDSNTKSRIIDIVQQDLQISRHLLGLLNGEREALQERRYSELADIVADKTEALDALDRHERKRRDLLAELGVDDSEQSWRQVIESAGDEGLTNSWRELRSTLGDCQRSNTINGRLIARGQQSMGRLLALLRGQHGAPELYNQAGIADGSYSSNTVIKV